MRVTSDTVLTATTQFGPISYFSFDRPIGESIEMYGQWAMAEIRFLRQFLRPGDTVIDGGANIGVHTLGFADACGPSGRVIAVEASPEVARILQRNIDDNQLGGVEQIAAALGDTEGTCRFSQLAAEGLQNVGMLSVVEEGAGQSTIEVPVFTIDSLSLQDLRLVKLDVEGHELKAIQGGLNTITRLSPIVSVELLNLDKSVPIYNLLTEKGYKAYFCSFAVYERDNFRNVDENIYGVTREASMLFLPDDMSLQVTAGAVVLPINNIDDLADALREMPQHGDRTEHDRNLQALIEDRSELERQLSSLQDLSPMASAEAWTHRLLVAEQAIRDLRHSAMSKADIVTMGIMQAELREVWRTLDRKAGQEALARVGDEVSDSVREAIHSLENRNQLTIDSVSENLASVREENRIADERLSALKAEMVVVREGIDRHRIEGVSNEAISIRLKTELSSLKEALLGRSEDRSNFVLTVEALEAKVSDLSRQVDKISQSRGVVGWWKMVVSWFQPVVKSK